MCDNGPLRVKGGRYVLLALMTVMCVHSKALAVCNANGWRACHVACFGSCCIEDWGPLVHL